MRTFITITRKGQTTLPAAIRRKLGLVPAGGRLVIRFDERHQELTIQRAVSIDELSERISRYIKPGTKPLTDIRAFRRKHRRADHQGYR